MNIKYNCKAWLVALSGLLFWSSCDNYLDKLPDNRMEIKDGKDIADLLVSAYPTTYPAYLLERYSDNTDHFVVTRWSDGGQFASEAYSWKEITDVSENESPQNIWQSCYSAVASANQALLAIGNSDAYPAQKGEALLCRAFSEFILANVFCEAYSPATASSKLGIPYPLKPEEHVGEMYERGTLQETYEQLNSDIEEGLPLIEDQYSQPKYHFNRSAAYAFAAQFNLFMGNYSKAINYADQVLGENAANNLRDWNAFYDVTPNGQSAPNYYVNSSEPANLLLLTFYSQWGAYYGTYNAGNEYSHGRLISQTEDLQSQGPWGASSDFGYTVFYNGDVSKYFVNKIPYSFEITDQQAQIGYPHCSLPVFTTDNLLLVRAEAKALNGDYDGAVNDLNLEVAALSSNRKTVTLSGINNFYNGISTYTPTTPTPKKKLNPVFGNLSDDTQRNIIDAILQLRRIITLGEGQRMLDVKRYGIVIYRRTLDRGNNVTSVTDSLTVNDPRRAIQLPQDVIESGMTPNPR